MQPLRDVRAAPGQQKRLLPQQTLDGHTVDVVQFRSSSPGFQQTATLYIDAQSYLLRKVSSSLTYHQRPDLNPRAVVTKQASTDLVHYEQMPPSAVPSFVFNAGVDPPFRVPGRHA